MRERTIFFRVNCPLHVKCKIPKGAVFIEFWCTEETHFRLKNEFEVNADECRECHFLHFNLSPLPKAKAFYRPTDGHTGCITGFLVISHANFITIRLRFHIKKHKNVLRCVITWMTLHHWIRFFNFCCPGITDSKMQRSPYLSKLDCSCRNPEKVSRDWYRKVLSEYAIGLIMECV